MNAILYLLTGEKDARSVPVLQRRALQLRQSLLLVERNLLAPHALLHRTKVIVFHDHNLVHADPVALGGNLTHLVDVTGALTHLVDVTGHEAFSPPACGKR